MGGNSKTRRSGAGAKICWRIPTVKETLGRGANPAQSTRNREKSMSVIIMILHFEKSSIKYYQQNKFAYPAI